VKLLADECVAGSLVKLLRLSGVDIEWVSETGAGLTDRQVLERSMQTGRVILTEDYDFADLIFRHGYKGVGIIILSASLTAKPSSEVAATVAKRLEKPGSEFYGTLTIFEPNRTRKRAFPASTKEAQ
jgi:predicted nuclease of predicted toxin-antitoxin system